MTHPRMLAEAGAPRIDIDPFGGILMNSIEPLALLDRVGRDLLLRLEAAGLRSAAAVAHTAQAA